MLILGLDQARSSGWSIFEVPDAGQPRTLAGPRDCLAFGVATTMARIKEVTALLRRLTSERENGYVRGLLNVYAVFEDHSKIPASWGRNTATLVGLGRRTGHWEAALWEIGMADSHIHRVEMGRWRSGVLGLRKSTPTDEAKAVAVRFVGSLVGNPQLSHDACEGYCIGLWGAMNLPGILSYGQVVSAAKRKARAQRQGVGPA